MSDPAEQLEEALEALRRMRRIIDPEPSSPRARGQVRSRLIGEIDRALSDHGRVRVEKPCCFCGESACSAEPCSISPDTRHFTAGEAASTIEAGAWENQRLRDALRDHGIEP